MAPFLSMFKPDKRLKKLYDKYNRELFDSSLPQDMQVGWFKLGEDAGTTATFDNELDVHHTVYVDEQIKGLTKYVHITLLHEMAHLKLHPFPRHGKKFDEEIARLFIRGAYKGLL